MPKKRITPKQKAASRRNLKIARAKREGVKPTGKNRILFHRTTPANAESIVKHGFDSGRAVRQSISRSKVDKDTFFSDRSHGDAKRHGSALLSVVVPRKSARRDRNFDTYKGETFYAVPTKALQGKRIRRHI